jgi:hypothetical protein
MSLLPEDAGYFEQLQAFFLAFRGDGVALSPLDCELLHEWHERGVPYEVVCRGIRRAAEGLVYGETLTARLRSLRACRGCVEREFKRYQGLAAGTPRTVESAQKGPADWATERLEKARRQVRKGLKSAEGALRCGLEAAERVLGAEASDPREVARFISRADEALALVTLRGLPFAERRRIVHQARELAGPARHGASPRARRDALRAHLIARVRTECELDSLA